MRHLILALILASVGLTAAADSAAQRPDLDGSPKAQTAAPRRCMDITVSYDAAGEASKVSIRSDCPDPQRTSLDALLPNEDVLAVLAEYFPPDKLGGKVSTINFSFGRAGGYTDHYAKVSVTVFGTCRDEICGTLSATAKRDTPKMPVRYLSP